MDELFPGGNVSSVSRVGDTVRRRSGPTTPAVHALLRHVRAAGFGQAPQPLGFDEEGREILTFVEGEVWHDPLPDVVWLDRTLTDAASLLRRLHDATDTAEAAVAGSADETDADRTRGRDEWTSFSPVAT